MNLSALIMRIRVGHLFLVLCCIFYLIWWSITFNPTHTFPALPKYILFVCIAAAGAVGGVLAIPVLGKLPVERGGIGSLVICLTGVGSYLLLLYLTGHFLHRQVTTELFLIVGWAVLELCVISSLYRADALQISYTLIMTIVIIAAAAVSMICYLCYYNMKPVPAFYDGMVPLLLFAAVMAAQALLIRSN